jgi:hypothetical protein
MPGDASADASRARFDRRAYQVSCQTARRGGTRLQAAYGAALATPVRGVTTLSFAPSRVRVGRHRPRTGRGHSQGDRADATPAAWRRTRAVPAPQPQARQRDPKAISTQRGGGSRRRPVRLAQVPREAAGPDEHVRLALHDRQARGLRPLTTSQARASRRAGTGTEPRPRPARPIRSGRGRATAPHGDAHPAHREPARRPHPGPRATATRRSPSGSARPSPGRTATSPKASPPYAGRCARTPTHERGAHPRPPASSHVTVYYVCAGDDVIEASSLAELGELVKRALAAGARSPGCARAAAGSSPTTSSRPCSPTWGGEGARG